MYHLQTIDKLSPNQLSKLLKGESVRIKSGTHHKVHLSVEQSKKHHKAHLKGKAVQIRFDPYQIANHAHLRGKGTLKDWGMEQYNKIPEAYHPGIESIGMAGLHQAGFGLKKIHGSGTLKDWGIEQYNKIPEAYHPGIESIGMAGLHQAGFGLKKRGRPRKIHGDGFFEDMGHAFTSTFTPELGRQVARGAIEYGLPAAVGGLTTLSGNPEFAPFTSAAMKYAAPSIERSVGLGLRRSRGRPRTKGGSMFGTAKHLIHAAAPVAGKVLKPIAKQVAREVVKYGAAAAGPAAAAAAIAAGQPELAPYAAMAGNMIAHKGAQGADRYIDGLGLKKSRGRPRKHHMHGTSLLAAGY